MSEADYRLLDALASGRGPKGVKRGSRAHEQMRAKWAHLLDDGLIEEQGGAWPGAHVTLALTTKGSKARHDRYTHGATPNGCSEPGTCACGPCEEVTRTVDRARAPGYRWWQRIQGGTARNPRSFNREQLLRGTMHELEHAKDPRIAMEIAMDHIAENRRAYIDVMPNGARSKRWIADAIKHPGKLGGPGFLARPPDEQLRILDRCRDEYGTRSCLGSVMLLERLAPARHRARLAVLHDYLKDSHRRGHGPTPNPDDGGWDAIPIIIVPIDLRGASLTRAQVIELSELTL